VRLEAVAGTPQGLAVHLSRLVRGTASRALLVAAAAVKAVLSARTPAGRAVRAR
jgi:hypothetical protein